MYLCVRGIQFALLDFRIIPIVVFFSILFQHLCLKTKPLGIFSQHLFLFRVKITRNIFLNVVYM